MVVLLQSDAMGCQERYNQTNIEHDANYIIAEEENKKKIINLAKQIIDDYQDKDEIINRVTSMCLETPDMEGLRQEHVL